MEKTNINSKTNGFTNSEMYTKSRGEFIELGGFWTSNLDSMGRKMTFAKAPNGSYAVLCSWLDGRDTLFEKVDGKWYRIVNEKAKEIQKMITEKSRKEAEEKVRSVSEDEASEDIKELFGFSYDEILQRIEKVNNREAKDFFDDGWPTLSIIERMQYGGDYTITSKICGFTVHNKKYKSTYGDFDVSVKYNLDRTRDAIWYVDKARYCEITACYRGSEYRKEFSFQGTDKWDFLVELNNAIAGVLEAYNETKQNNTTT